MNDAIRAEMDALKINIATLESDVAEIKAKMETNIENLVESSDKIFVTLHKHIQDNAAAIASLNAKIDAKFIELKSEINDLDAKLNDLGFKFNEIIAKLNEHIANSNARFVRVESMLQIFGAKLDSIIESGVNINEESLRKIGFASKGGDG